MGKVFLLALSVEVGEEVIAQAIQEKLNIDSNEIDIELFYEEET